MALLAGLRSFTIKNSDSPCILKLHIQPFITGKVQGPNGNRTIQALCKMPHATGTMKNATGVGKPGEPVNNRPHLGDLILQKYEHEIPEDLWGIIFGYPLSEVHQFTYDWDTWNEKQKKRRRKS